LIRVTVLIRRGQLQRIRRVFVCVIGCIAKKSKTAA
jgi:hypothetical protein